jgi:hypothetical protein
MPDFGMAGLNQCLSITGLCYEQTREAFPKLQLLGYVLESSRYSGRVLSGGVSQVERGTVWNSGF